VQTGFRSGARHQQARARIRSDWRKADREADENGKPDNCVEPDRLAWLVLQSGFPPAGRIWRRLPILPAQARRAARYQCYPG
jgi:hypothetical protein